MKKALSILTLIAMIPFHSQAALVAVTDSGTDFSHEWLKGRNWTNEREVAGNLVDDDGNGKVDDTVGWNFVDGYGKVFFRDHLDYINPVTFKIFEVIARQQSGTATDEDKKFWAANVTGLPAAQKAALLAHLNFYGQYAHGTHVAGIVASMTTDSKIIPARIFADEPPAEYVHPISGAKGMADLFYKLFAILSNGTFDQVASYLNESKADVANYSLGISLQMIAKLALGIRGIDKPTAEQLSAETKRVAAQYEPIGRKWMESSPGTLFVIAAGNDGTDNDALPVFPAFVRVNNSITVAASHGNGSLATFSNYGLASVDVAAPGVAMVSSVPSLDSRTTLPMSGTSMAAPYVAGLAARLKEINADLKPADLKVVLMATVDRKEWLKGKVISAGVVNPKRAAVAAEKSRTMNLVEAIKFAVSRVPDEPTSTGPVVPSVMKSPADLQQFARQLVF